MGALKCGGVALLVMHLTLWGCDGGGGSEAPEHSVTATVTAEGGTLEMDGMTLEIPAGALAGPTEITVSLSEAIPSGYATYSPVFRFQPSGTVFAVPAKLSVDFDGDLEYATVFWSRPDEPGYERVETEIFETRATASISHFSEGFVADDRVCSITDNGDGTKTIDCNDGTSATVSDGAPGEDGTSCSVEDNGDGTKTITCTDGTSVTLADGDSGVDGLDGANGISCSVEDNGDGTKTISCTDGTSVTVADGAVGVDGLDGENGADGQDGTSCTVEDNGDGTMTISCTDGTSATVSSGTDGVDGTSCTVEDNGDGTKTISCTDGTSVTVADGVDGEDGQNGTDGTSCTVEDNGDGTMTISCMDGTSATVSSGTDGVDGTSCIVEDNGDGTVTISCTDGTSVTVADGVDGEDGQNGTDGTSCTVEDNGDGTVTISCTDGTSVTVADGSADASCALFNNGDGTMTLTCSDGTSITLQAAPAPETILSGSYQIDNSMDLALLQGYEEITGNLIIDATGLQFVVLPALKDIGGELEIIGTTIEELSLPALETVGGSLWMKSPSLLELSLPSLVSVGALYANGDSESGWWAMDLLDLPNLTTCGHVSIGGVPLSQGVFLPGLTGVDNFSLSCTKIGPLSLESVVTAGSIWVDCAGLTSLSMPALTTVTSHLSLEGLDLVEVSLPALDSVGELRLSSMAMPVFTLGSLAQVSGGVFVSEFYFSYWGLYDLSPPEGGFEFYWGALEEIHLPNLTGSMDMLSVYMASDGNAVDGNGLKVIALPGIQDIAVLEVEHNTSLIDLSLGGLTTVSGPGPGSPGYYQAHFSISSNDSLETISLPSIASIVGDLELSGNDALVTLTMPLLETVQGGLYVGYNDVLESFHFPSLATIGPSDENGYLNDAVRFYKNYLLPQCLIDDFLTQVTVDGTVSASQNRTDCVCSGDPVTATCGL